MVELVYKFDEKSYRECLIAKVRFKLFLSTNNIYIDTNTDHFIPLMLRVRDKNRMKKGVNE